MSLWRRKGKKESESVISAEELDMLGIDDYDILKAEGDAIRQVEFDKLRKLTLKSQDFFYRAPKKRVVFIGILIFILFIIGFIYVSETLPDYLRGLVSPY